jgi:[protein-PII] uridylyltransferase
MLPELRTAQAVSLTDGGAPARRRASAVDTVLADLADKAFSGDDQVAIVAVGGYGRGDLSPRSDIDLLILPAGGEPDARLRERLQELLYPLWDAGFEVGHAVRDPDQAIEQAAEDLDAATAMLSARLVAGSQAVFEQFVARRRRWLETNARRLVQRILDRTAERHRQVERAGWVLAPDLKQDVGGLRDLHLVGWLAAVVAAADDRPSGPTRPGFGPSPELTEAAEVLLAVREVLHELGGKRKLDRVRIDLQPALAKRLVAGGAGGVDQLMARVHTAARQIEHLASVESQRLAERVLGGPRRSGRVEVLGHGVRVEDGVLNLAPTAAAAPGPAGGLRLLAAEAATGRPIAPALHDWLADCFSAPAPARWDEASRAGLLDLLPGPFARRALERLDHAGGWQALLPEWSAVRGLAQYDLYHRYTVDGHLFATVAGIRALLDGDGSAPAAREAAGEAGDLTSLYLAALLHDVGKGSGEDHSVAGERLARSAAGRVGLDAPAVDEVAGLVRDHLLLAVTATRRDLDDPAVVRAVATRVGEPRRLHLLYLLTVADARATGPLAWTSWKDALVRELYRKTLRVLDRAEPPPIDEYGTRAVDVAAAAPDLATRAEELLRTFPPSYLRSAAVGDLADELRLLLAARAGGGARARLDVDGARGQPVVTVCVPDRLGTLARTSGVLALNRISVLRAQTYSTTDGLAIERFVVDPPPDANWDRVAADLDAAWNGRLAVEARLERKARDYHPGGEARARDVVADVRVLTDASAAFTIVEVRAPDALGLLSAISAALADLDLDIRTAKIDTQGRRVIDVFYVRTPSGEKLGEDQAAEVRLAIRHRIGRLLG